MRPHGLLGPRAATVAVGLACVLALTGCGQKPPAPNHGYSYSYVYLLPPPSAIKATVGVDARWSYEPYGWGAQCDALDAATFGRARDFSNGVPGNPPRAYSSSYDPSYKAAIAEYHLELGGHVIGTAQADTMIRVMQSPGVDVNGQPFDFMAAVKNYPCPDQIKSGQMTIAQLEADTSSDQTLWYPAFAIDGLPAGVVGYAYPENFVTKPPLPNDVPIAQLPAPGYAVLYAEQDGYFVYIIYGYDNNGPQPEKAGKLAQLVMQTIHDNYQKVNQMMTPPNCLEVNTYLEEPVPDDRLCAIF